MKKPEPYKNWLLRFIYKNRLGKIFRKIINKKWFSLIIGFYCDLRISRIHIKSFVRKYGINLDEVEKPLNQYKTFNNFFIRRLKPVSRIINFDKDVVVSPCDGTILAIENILPLTNFPLKGLLLNMEKLIGNSSLFEKYQNGTLILLRLAPKDYHRFHFPTDCIPSKPIKIPGLYDSVDPIVYEGGIMPLIDNERHIIFLSTKLYKIIIMIPIGALCVGRISETYKANIFNAKGAEAGYFSFGGSSIALLFERGVIELREDIILNSKKGLETNIIMGEGFGFRKIR